MNFFRKPYRLRRYMRAEIVRGYYSLPYTDLTLLMDIQTMEDEVITTPDGSRSVQKLKVFCDSEIRPEDVAGQKKADRLWFQGKWFECRSSRLSENTPLRHWTATFVECLDAEAGPGSDPGESGDSGDESE